MRCLKRNPLQTIVYLTLIDVWRTRMLGASDIGGMMAMMAAFATDQAADLRATDTVSVERLRAGAHRMARDGANLIATTGRLGGCHALLAKEFAQLGPGT